MKLPFQTAPVGRKLTRWCHQGARLNASAFPSAKAPPPTCASLGGYDPTSDACNFTGAVSCDSATKQGYCCNGNIYHCHHGCCFLPSGILEVGALPSLLPGHELCIKDDSGNVIICARAVP
jgi:hypothetical protein